MPPIDVNTKPLPEPTPVSSEYWEGLREGEIRMQRCTSCGKLQFYPRSGCRHCGGTDLSWEVMSGPGQVYSFTIIHRPPFKAFEQDVPYVYALVELDEGPRIVCNVVTDDLDSVEIGMRVVPRFDAITDDIALLRFAPA